MLIRNALVYCPDFRFHRGSLRIKNGLIEKVFFDTMNQPIPEAGEEVLEAGGAYLLPGLVDIHFHGCAGYDVCDGATKALREIAAYELKSGTTAICPATLTLPARELKRILSCMADFAQGQAEGAEAGASLIGINMEGPFISRKKKGAQNEKYILPCSSALAMEFIEASRGLVKLIGLAPEENPDGFLSFIRRLKDRVRISIAHSNADYDTAMSAFSAGASHAVHLFNGMSSLHHRDPGIAGAVFDSPGVFAEIIGDGNHLHPAVVRLLFAALGEERLVLVSDSLRAAGMGEGEMDLGGQTVVVQGKKATLKEGGNLAGSVSTLLDCLRVIVEEAGIPLEKAVRTATLNPARAIGEEARFGSFEEGKRGDAVLLSDTLELRAVVQKGKRIV